MTGEAVLVARGWAGRWRAWVAGVLAVVVATGCAPTRSSIRPVAKTVPLTVSRIRVMGPRAQAPPEVAGTGAAGLAGLWQGAPWDDLTIAGGLVLGVSESAGATQVHAVRAATGAPVWTVALHGSQWQVMGLAAAGKVIIVEIGHDVARGAEASLPPVFDYVALSLGTGRQLWVAPARGLVSPVVAATGNLVLTGDRSGVVTARNAATGAVAWRERRPRACAAGPGTAFLNAGMGLAADGSLASVSFDCGPSAVVQRLDPVTGRPLWTWTSPPAGAGAWASLAVVAAARDGNLVLLAGQIGPPPAAAQFTARLPSPLQWPSVLAPSDQESPVLALDAATGHPRWTELGGQQESFALSGGAACEMVNTGLECRNDVTGSPTLPVLVTGQPVSASPPYGGDQLAGISGGIAAVTTSPFRSGIVTVRVIAVRSGVTVAQVRLDIGTHAYGGANYQVFVTAAGTLPSGAILALVRRIDVASFPVVALRIQPPQPR